MLEDYRTLIDWGGCNLKGEVITKMQADDDSYGTLSMCAAEAWPPGVHSGKAETGGQELGKGF